MRAACRCGAGWGSEGLGLAAQQPGCSDAGYGGQTSRGVTGVTGVNWSGWFGCCDIILCQMGMWMILDVCCSLFGMMGLVSCCKRPKIIPRPYMACLTSPGPEAWPQEAERTHQGAFQQLHPGIHIFSQVPLATVVSIFSCFSLNFHFYLDFVRWWSLKTMQYHQWKYDFISLLLERFLWCWVIKLTNHLTVLRSTLWHISYGLVASDSTFNTSKAQGSWIWTAISLTPRRPASEWADRFLGQSAISL